MTVCVHRCIGVAAVLLAFLLCAPVELVRAVEPIDPGINDLVILDPAKHERGLPAVELVPQSVWDGIGCDSDAVPGLGPTIDIPPKVHVHRYYYSGDKIYQGPIIHGGPTVVVAKHPKTGEQMYINVVLPAGAPRIAYTQHCISYIYSDRRVEVKFRHFPFNPDVAIVRHHHGKGFHRHLNDTSKHVRENVREGLENSQVAHSVGELAAGGGEIVRGAAATVGCVSEKGVDTVKVLSGLIPGVTYLRSKAGDRPQRIYEGKVNHWQRLKDKAQIPFARTNQ